MTRRSPSFLYAVTPLGGSIMQCFPVFLPGILSGHSFLEQYLILDEWHMPKYISHGSTPLECWRKGRDSNPRRSLHSSPVPKTGPISHSGTLPAYKPGTMAGTSRGGSCMSVQGTPSARLLIRYREMAISNQGGDSNRSPETVPSVHLNQDRPKPPARHWAR